MTIQSYAYSLQEGRGKQGKSANPALVEAFAEMEIIGSIYVVHVHFFRN
jgi:hypothetical protein